MRTLIPAFLAICGFAFLAAPAHATPDFKKAFENKYVKPAGDPEFEKAFKEASCNACHVKGKGKGVRNDYGKALDARVPGNAQARIKAAVDKAMGVAEKAKVLEEFEKAMTEVETMDAPGGGTWGDLFKKRELPSAPKE